MNLADYREKYFSIYQDFARTTRFILKEALLAADNLPRPQSIQCRAKGIESLRRRLAEEGKLGTQTLESDRCDLAGVRLIFYTDNDVDRFLASPLIREMFEIVDFPKTHYPTQENKEAQYRAHHYTVQLRKDRIGLPEYARFNGLHCEIQVQTILNHAWSETSHDILYKGKLGHGYGEKAIKGIRRRFERIMDRYLKPAGYEIQMAQQEYERILQGKELFDKNITELLDNAQDNNKRYEILSGLKDYAIPNYDDLPTAYKGLKGPLLRAVKAARAAKPVPIETIYGPWKGYTQDSITKLVVEIVESLRYIDVPGTLRMLIDIYQDEPNDDIRGQIVNVVRALSEFNIDVYRKVGPSIQLALVDYLGSMSDAEIDGIRPIALTVWTETLQSDVTGTKWHADTLTWTTGALPVSNQIMEVRGKALFALFSAYNRSTNDEQKLAVLSALDAATRTPNRVQSSKELLVITLKDAARIVNFVTERSGTASYELLQHLEQQFLHDYLRAKDLIKEQGCQVEATALVAAILQFRDKINSDESFVRYKILVGFKSVYPGHWAEEKFDYGRADEYRRGEANRYIDEINSTNEINWFDLIGRCAETRSNDLATFPVFGDFISNLAHRKPEVADRLLARASGDLRRFLAGFLDGLARSGRRDIYERILESELESARNLPGMVRHIRYSKVTNPEYAARLLNRAIDTADSIAVIECLLFALEHYGTEKIADADTFVRRALAFLNDRQDPRWVSEAWFLQKETKFYIELTQERATQILQNLGYLNRINYEADCILARLAKRFPDAIWDYFEARLGRAATEKGNENPYEAVPFQFHELGEELSKDPRRAITRGLLWFKKDPKLFRYRGGNLLSNAFPKCNENFAFELAELVKAGGDTEAEFALDILENYEGEIATYIVLKEIVSGFPHDRSKMSQVEIAIDNTGVVTGELGFAEAYRSKKESLKEWLADERLSVTTFAKRHIAKLDNMIASELRRAELDREMRKRAYNSEDEEADGNDSDSGE